MHLPPLGVRTDNDRAAIRNALHIASLHWVSSEEDTMRRAGLNRWKVDGTEAYLRWQVPLDERHPDIDAYLTLRATDWDGHGHTHWRLVWQLKVFRVSLLVTDIRQVVLAHLNEASMANTTLEEVVDLLYSVEPAELISWTKRTLNELGLKHALRDRV